MARYQSQHPLSLLMLWQNHCLSAFKLNPCPMQGGKKVSHLLSKRFFYGRTEAKKWQKAKKAAPSQSAEATRKYWHAVQKFKVNKRPAE